MIASKFFHRRMIPNFHRILVPILTIGVVSASAPVASDDVIAGKQDTQFVLDYLLLCDKDADGNALNITATTNPAHGVLTASGGNSYKSSTGMPGRQLAAPPPPCQFDKPAMDRHFRG